MGGTAPATPASLGAVPSLSGRRLGRYQVLSQLAAGGMAGVYVARALAVAGFERLVAVKVLHPHLAHEEEFISMFLDEARLAARIHHPNVVATLDISDTEGDGFFLVMDYIEGHHLGALLQQAAKDGLRVPPPVVLRVVLDALAGLAAAHDLVDEHGVPLQLVHRDISPHNIMVGTDGIGRLTDFGVAKAEVRLTSTREGQFKGKLAYMAPEHASTGATDQRSDLFAMGIILWEGLTGRRLFRADTNAQTLNKILIEPIPEPSEARPELAPFDAICARALERDPARRFQSADEFSEALELVAPTVGGIATARQVGEVVRKLAAEKLGKEKVRIQEAIRSLSSGEGSMSASMPTPRNASEPSMPSMPSRSRSMPAGAWAGAQASTPSKSLPGVPRPGALGPPPGMTGSLDASARHTGSLSLPRDSASVSGALPSDAQRSYPDIDAPVEAKRRNPVFYVLGTVAAILIFGAIGTGAFFAIQGANATSTPVGVHTRAVAAPNVVAPAAPAAPAQPAVAAPGLPTAAVDDPEAGATLPAAQLQVGAEPPATPTGPGRRRHRDRDRTGSGSSAPTGGGSDDDELMNNPYRR